MFQILPNNFSTRMDDKKNLQIVDRYMVAAIFICWSLYFVGLSGAAELRDQGRDGSWQLLMKSTGVVAMHMALTHRNTVIMFDQTRAGQSKYRVRQRYNGTKCGHSHHDLEDWSCYAHSVEYDISGNKIRPLTLVTDPWCSSGAFLSNGTLLQTGGYHSGGRRIRYLKPCDNGHCDWKQSKHFLSSKRWYASTQILPENDRVIVVGGRRVFNYEFVPKQHSDGGAIDLPFLHQTFDDDAPGNNLYPFLHLSPDGNLFIFANRDSILLDYRRNNVVKKYPRIPGGGSRNYPSSGSSVILPLDHRDNFRKMEVMVCGGAASGATRAARNGRFLKGLSSCGRMVITGNRHKWNMENMPEPRLLNDMLILPTGHILIINGAKRGCAGWENAAGPSRHPYLYNPRKRHGKRFSILSSTNIARMYHSSAIVLPDGRILVAGGNPYRRYITKNVTYPTELRLQAFTPRYMNEQFHGLRPANVSILYKDSTYSVKHGKVFNVQFRLGRVSENDIEFTAYAPPFTTHSVSMNQRMLILRCNSLVQTVDGWITAALVAPPSPNVAPSGYYLLTIVNRGIPSLSHWVRFAQA